LTEQTAGFILTQASGQYVGGLNDGVDHISKSIVQRLVNDDGTVVADASGSNQGSNYIISAGAPLTEVNIGLSYNPWSHFVIGGIRANCNLPSGTVIGNYVLRFQVDGNGIPLGPASACNTRITPGPICMPFTVSNH